MLILPTYQADCYGRDDFYNLATDRSITIMEVMISIIMAFGLLGY